VWVQIRALLALDDETIFLGSGFGYPCEVSGEVVFNTGMMGYPESLTDPSYCGQILTQTYPLIGNYGIPSYSMKNEGGIPLHFESDRVQVNGYVVHSLTKNPSHWASEKTLDQWLYEHKIPGIEGIDTRDLTKRLRIKGTMLGILKVSDDIDIEEIKQKLKKIQDPNDRDLVQEVTIDEPIVYNSKNSPTVAVIDCGCKFGILRNLVERKLNVVRVPYDYPSEKILDFDPAGIVISNGPGDPKKCTNTVDSTKKFLETGIPIMGICLGNQILSLAVGADTYKLKFGHRGQNHPAIDLFTKKCYITSQNHGFAVDSNSLKGTDFDVWLINANDKTVEGIKHKGRPIFAIQFHPEASPGPYETEFLFDQFVKEVKKFQ
jgi:carbamoyl-phosphate synthase small subunit